MSDMKTVLPPDSVKCSKEGDEKIHVPLKPLPTVQEGRVPVHHYGHNMRSLNRVQTKHRQHIFCVRGCIRALSTSLLSTAAVASPFERSQLNTLRM
jgi:hypothetical protein